MIQSEKILLNTGPSDRGFHRLEAYLRCPKLFAWGYGRKGSKHFPATFPLARGSIVHVGLAHVYARLKWVQEGKPLAENPYHDPITAMQLVAEEFEDLGEEALPAATKAVKGYAKHYGAEPFRVVAVEEPLETEFLGYRYTARADLILEDRGGKIWIVDHKAVGKIEGKVFRRYVLSGQFLGLAHLGARQYGTKFGGVRLNLLGCNVAGFARATPEPAPYALERFPHVVKYAEEGIAQVEKLLAAGEPIPMAVSEHVCMGSYGECPAFSLCQFGELDFRSDDQEL